MLLIRDAISQKNLPRDTEDNVTAAITALRAVIHHFPDPGTALGRIDSSTLRAEEQQRVDQAHIESDSGIRNSLHRRVEALIHSADSADETHQWLRWTAYLRQELDAQITSLRHSLQANMDGDIAIGIMQHAAN